MSARDYYANNASAMTPVRQSMASVLKGFGALHHGAVQPGALRVRDKELIALSIGVAVRCEHCIYAHVQGALKAGASREQIIDGAGVAVIMGGGPAYTYLPRVIEALDALQSV
jgi:AhpD family alkylhydroperoxidase